MTIRVKILFFAMYKDLAGVPTLEMELGEHCTIAELKKILAEKYPDIKSRLDYALVAVNREFAANDQEILNDSDIAFFPPVSGGGMDFPTVILLTDKEIELDGLFAQLPQATTGAACIFTGIVRGITNNDGQRVTQSLVYETYQTMAFEKMQQIADEIRERWPSIEAIVLVQRLGELTPGTLSTVIICTAAHRNEGVFEGARYGIDRLKEIVPVWKKEFSSDGNYWVEGNYFPRPGE